MLVAVEDSTSEHTGSTVVGAVAGTVKLVSQGFVKINGLLVMVESDTMEIPTHQYSILPELYHSHSYSPDSLQNSYFFIEGSKVVVVGDSYISDATEVKDSGGNSFVSVV